MDALWDAAKAAEKRRGDQSTPDGDALERSGADPHAASELRPHRDPPWPGRRAPSSRAVPSSSSAFAITSVWRCSQLDARPVGRIEREIEHARASQLSRASIASSSVVDPLPGQRRHQDRPLAGRPALGEVVQSRAAVGVEPVDLVPDLDQPLLRRSGSMPSSRSTSSTSRDCASVSSCETSRTCRITSASITSSSVARNAATSMVGRSEMKPTVSDRMIFAPLRQRDRAQRRIERGEQHVGRQHARRASCG